MSQDVLKMFQFLLGSGFKSRTKKYFSNIKHKNNHNFCKKRINVNYNYVVMIGLIKNLEENMFQNISTI